MARRIKVGDLRVGHRDDLPGRNCTFLVVAEFGYATKAPWPRYRGRRFVAVKAGLPVNGVYTHVFDENGVEVHILCEDGHESPWKLGRRSRCKGKWQTGAWAVFADDEGASIGPLLKGKPPFGYADCRWRQGGGDP